MRCRMTKQYKGFSKQGHIETSQAINEICRQLYVLSEKVTPAYGVSSAVGKIIERLVITPNVMDRLKSKLDDAYLGEHGGKPTDSPYY